jgi:hypothetical protein
MKKSIGAGLIALSLAACGGGGGGSPAAQVPATPATPAPTVTLAISVPKVTLGSSATLTWSSTNSTSCTASGAWSGTQAVSGTAAQTPTAAGAGTYTLTCTGAGGTANQSVALTVPIPVLKSSYENKIAAGKALGAQTMPADVTESNSVAFADFFQDGSYSMVTHSLEYDYTAATASKLGHIRFYKNVNGTWIDNTSKLLTDNVGCVHPRKTIVADFNNDGLPDVFFACHGVDADPYPGEKQHMLMSQADGTYKNVTLPDICYCHSASAGDINGDGYVDILVTDNMVQQKPYFLINKKDGTFTRDMSHFPAMINAYQSNGQPGITGVNTGNAAIYTSELIDFSKSGRYDAFLAGTAPDNHFGNWPPTIFKNDGSGVFSQSRVTVLPYMQQYQTTLDIVVDAGSIYLTNVHLTYDAAVYGFSNIVKIDPVALTSTQIYGNTVNFNNGHGWLNWIIPYQGKIVSQSAAYGVSVPE